MSSVAEELPKEMTRVRELLPLYDAIPSGVFAASMMRNDLDRAEQPPSKRQVAGSNPAECASSSPQKREG